MKIFENLPIMILPVKSRRGHLSFVYILKTKSIRTWEQQFDGPWCLIAVTTHKTDH